MNVFTTKNKKIIASVGLTLTGWFAVSAGSNPLNLPVIPAWLINPLVSGFSLLTVAGAVAVIAAVMVWTEY